MWNGSLSETPVRIAIIGGGFTGAALAIHAIRQSLRPLTITIIEPLADLGRGVAYSATDSNHRINVPSHRMGLFAADPDEATHWFIAQGVLPDSGSDDGTGAFYVPRSAYGAFVKDALRRTVQEAEDRVRFHHNRARATAVTRTGSDWSVHCDDGQTVASDVVALCFGHAAPGAPCPIADNVALDPKFIPDPWAPAALAAIQPRDTVLIIGTGLTMADVVMSLRARGHVGQVNAVSRRGLLPRPHGLFQSDVDLLEGDPAPETVLDLLMLMRRRIRQHQSALGWQPVIDSLRAQLPVLWNTLSGPQKRKALRKLLPYWDVHRFRIAPQIDAALTQARTQGRLVIERAAVTAIVRQEDGLVATLRAIGGNVAQRRFDAVILCTGPQKDLRGNTLIAGLLADGLAHLDETGFGLAVNMRSQVLGAGDRPSPSLLAFGPMTRGTFGEMTGAPDIVKHIEQTIGGFLQDATNPAQETM